MAVVIETTLGDFTVDLYIEDRPHTCKNFLKLCKMKYYNFCLFHSVQHNFIAQTGDPTGTGKSGESVYGKIHGEEKKFFEAEMMPKIKHTRSGLLSMVNCGNNMLGSQFFLTLGCELQSLDNEHCIFGEVSEGHEILLKLNDVICDTEHRPYQDIRITHTVILEDPFDDPPGLYVPDYSPEPSKETLLNARIAPDEELDETKGRSAAELEETARERQAKAQATILEIVGDLPDAEIAPPENVLFVCKLNPVTTDDDLEIIFSRFGKVKGCEVIRDKVTGDSLQYAFVEFEEQKSCEDAFFKMDNVLIDDRRIHVDFSQSVSKMRWKGKGRGVEHFDGQPNTKFSSRNNTSIVQDHKQSKGGLSKREEKHERDGYRDSSRSNKHDDKRDHAVKRYDLKKDNAAMNDRHKVRNKGDKNERDEEERAQEYLSPGDHRKNMHGNDSRMHKHVRESSYKNYPSSDRRYRDDNNSHASLVGSSNRYKEDNTSENIRKSRNEKDDHYQGEYSSGKKYRDENKDGTYSSKNRSERDASYQEDSSSRNRYRDDNKKENTSRNEKDFNYQDESSSGNRYAGLDESKNGSTTRNDKDESSLGSKYKDENKRGSKSRNEVDVSYKDESTLGNKYRDEYRKGSKSRNEVDVSYKDESGSPNRYKDESKRGRPSENRSERDVTHQTNSISSSKYKDKDRKHINSDKGGRDSSYRERVDDSMHRNDEHTSRSERDLGDKRRYRGDCSDTVNPCRDKERAVYTSKDARDVGYQTGASLVGRHRCEDIEDRSCRPTCEGEEASLRETTSSKSKHKKTHEDLRKQSSETKNVLSNHSERAYNDGGKDNQKVSRVESEEAVNRSDLRKEEKVDKREVVQKERHRGELLAGEHSKSKVNIKGVSVKKTKKHRSPSSSSSSSDSESSSSSTSGSSSSTSGSSSTSSSDSSVKVSQAKRRKLSKKVTSKKRNVKNVNKSTKGKKVKQEARKSKRKESSSDKSSSASSTTSSSSSSDTEQKYVKRSKKI